MVNRPEQGTTMVQSQQGCSLPPFQVCRQGWHPPATLRTDLSNWGSNHRNLHVACVCTIAYTVVGSVSNDFMKEYTERYLNDMECSSDSDDEWLTEPLHPYDIKQMKHTKQIQHHHHCKDTRCRRTKCSTGRMCFRKTLSFENALASLFLLRPSF